jgi:heptosyltransferase-2
VVGPSWVGDMVMAQALYRRLKQRDPQCAIDVLAPAWSLPVLSRMPELNEAIAMPVGHGQLGLRARFRLARGLRVKGYQQAIVLPRSFKSALIPYFAGIPKRTGWLGECRWGLLNDVRRLKPHSYPLMVERYLALGFEKGTCFQVSDYWPSLFVDEDARANTVKRLGLNVRQKILVLAPGAQYGPSKQWPIAYYAELSKQMLALGWHVWVMGGKGDQALAQTIIAQAGGGVDLTGHPFAVSIDLMSLADKVVCNDSGLMHVAAALGRAVIAIYGSTSPSYTPPLTDNARIVSLSMDCKPCFKRDCPLGHHRCMRQISVAMIYRLLLESP